MLDEVFYWILNMSIIASVFGVLICSVRFMKGCPKFVSYILWAVVLIRFLCPIGISSEYSLLNLVSELSERAMIRTVPLDNSVNNAENVLKFPELSASNMIQKAESYHPVTYETNVLEKFFARASIVWVIIAVSAIIAMLVLYYLSKSELKKAVPISDNIYEGTMVNTPTVYGIWKPKIVLPVGLDEEHKKYILAHEYVHIRRHDNVWRMLAILTACVHWFNPLSWILLKVFLKDCELACDVAAIKKMNTEERKDYARILLTYATADPAVFSSAFGSSKVKVRIKNVLSYKKLTVFSGVCFTCMVIILAFLLLTNAG